MNSTARSPGCSPHVGQQRLQLPDDGAHLLNMFRFDFISAPKPDGIFILAAKHRAAFRKTIALVCCSALDQPRQIVERCLGTLGCDEVLFVFPDLKSVADIATWLCHPPPQQSMGRIGLITHAAWQTLLADSGTQLPLTSSSSAEPSPPPPQKTSEGTRRDRRSVGRERFRP